MLKKALAYFMVTISCAVLAQQPAVPVTILYTGKSLGALGIKRSTDEQDLLVERLVSAGRQFKLVSHPAWRAPGITIFLPTQDPAGNELASLIANRTSAERLQNIPGLVSATNLLFVDPWRSEEDLLGMVWDNPRRLNDFPDLVKKTVTISRMRTSGGERAYILEEANAVWPESLSAWSVGEMYRVDVGTSRMISLPINLGGLGPRAALLRSLAGENPGRTLTVDLGQEDGEAGLTRMQRAQVDYLALSEMNYRFQVPYEVELELGPDSLKVVLKSFPSIQLLAANVSMGDTALIKRRTVVEIGGFKIGLIGLVNSNLKDKLTRGVLSVISFESPITAAKREIAALHGLGVSAIVVLSNMDPAENAVVAQEVKGIDAIIADMPSQTAPEAMKVSVDLADRPFARPGTPAMVARAAADGMTVGKLELALRFNHDASDSYVSALTHQLFPVNDKISPDTVLVKKVTAGIPQTRRSRGVLLFPAFTDLVTRHPDLAEYDAVTRLGRVSKPMWEAFMARRIRVQGNAEVAVIRRLDQFPPLQGKLREQEIMPWVWIDDAIILLDMPGSDLRGLLSSETRNE
ncbi:MAG: hypothetical protein ACKOYP_00795, partial [Bacteroidota bacterium]